MNFKNVFIGFRNYSFEKIEQRFADKKISEKEKYLFTATCENSVNSVVSIVDVFNAKKDLTENDFGWLMQTYTSSCIRELYDIFDNVRRESINSEIIKNSIDVDFPTAMNHLQILIGGEDVKKYFDTTLEFIKSVDSDVKGFDQFLIGRTTPIFILLKENDVKLDSIPPEQLLKTAQDNFDNSIKNFIKICCRA